MTLSAPAELTLSALRDEDAPILHSWRNDPTLRDGTLGYVFPTNIDAEREWIRSFSPKATPSDICLALREIDGRLVGYAQLRSIDWIGKVAEVGLVIGPSASRRQGLGTASLALLMEYATRQLDLRRLWLRVVQYNEPAIRLYERAGFLQEGRLRRHALRDGKFHDVLLYGWESTDETGVAT